MAGGAFLGRPEDEAFLRSAHGDWAIGPDPDVGLFTGAFSSVYGGVKHGLDVAGAFAADTLTDPIKAVAPNFVDDWLDGQRREVHQNLADSRADPRSIGTIGQAVHALGTVATEGAIGAVVGGVAGPLGAKAGAVSAIGALSAYDKYDELIMAGVDDSTAMKVAGVTGAVMGVGAMLPAFLGSTLSKQVASGIGLNVGLGFAERGGSSAILEDAGYKDMADHYKMLDGSAIAVDAILGAFFPLGARVLNRVSLREVDTAMDANRTVSDQLRDPGLQTKPENIDAKAAADVEIARQLVEENRTPDAIEVPRGVMDETVPNPAILNITESAARAVDDLITSEGGASLKDIDSVFTRIADVYGRRDAAVREQQAAPKEQPVASEKMDDETIIENASDRAVTETIEKDPLRQVLDDEGQVRNAKDFVEEAKRNLEDQQKEASLYKVAIACAIGVGE